MAKSKLEIKRLTRSRKDRMIAGVCGGIAKFYSLDPTMIRLLWAVLTVFTMVFPGIVLYLIAWVIIPDEN